MSAQQIPLEKKLKFIYFFFLMFVLLNIFNTINLNDNLTYVHLRM